jgi:hypothetical protein
MGVHCVVLISLAESEILRRVRDSSLAKMLRNFRQSDPGDIQILAGVTPQGQFLEYKCFHIFTSVKPDRGVLMFL